jgi:hypothetical protein
MRTHQELEGNMLGTKEMFLKSHTPSPHPFPPIISLGYLFCIYKHRLGLNRACVWTCPHIYFRCMNFISGKEAAGVRTDITVIHKVPQTGVTGPQF